MSERERLIELLIKAHVTFGTCNIADYLLANGVIVPPCKVGDIVYGISRKQIIPITIDAIQYTSRGVEICGSNEEHFGYGLIHLDIDNKIGMKWYCTKEEAEETLKGGGEE